MKLVARSILIAALLATSAHAHGSTYENWLFWWFYNRDDVLNSRERMDRPPQRSDWVVHVDTRMTGEDIVSKIVPALRQVIANRKLHDDIRGSALIALARARPPDLDADRFLRVAAADSGEDKVVRESAVVALAVAPCRGEKARAFLLSLARNRDEPVRLRCFAMLALGLLRDATDETFAALAARLDGNETEPDAPVCALAAMGLIGDARRVPTLLGWLSEGRVGRTELTDLTRAWVVGALGKIGDPRAVENVAYHLSRPDRFTGRSAAIGMGQLVPALPPERQARYVRLLTQAHSREKEMTTRNFALLSLGRIGAAPSTTAEAKAVAKACLLRLFREGNPTTERPFAALALGLHGRANPGDRAALCGLIRRELGRMSGSRIALGALALSLGMMEDRDASRLLMRIVSEKPNRPKLRAAAATALGMSDDLAARFTILSAVREREDRDLRIDTATALGMLRDRRGAEHLIEVMANPGSSQFTVGSAALALGPLGDRRAVDPLLEILDAGKTDGTYPELTRALVVVALGQMADRRPLRVLFRLSRDINYRASVPALDEILCIL